MKTHISLTVVLAAFLVLTPILQAQTVAPTSRTSSPSATVNPTANPEENQVESLKNSIATKVAELRKKGFKAVAGTISSISGLKIVIKNSLGSNINIKLDEELTKVYQINGATKQDLKQSDLEKNSYIIVSGPQLDNEITANVIYIDEQYFVKTGKIVEVNEDDLSLKVTTSERDTIILDISTRQKLQLMDTDTFEVATTTFKKVKEGDSVHFIYTKSGEEQQVNRFDALKVIVIPQEFFLQTKTET